MENRQIRVLTRRYINRVTMNLLKIRGTPRLGLVFDDFFIVLRRLERARNDFYNPELITLIISVINWLILSSKYVFSNKELQNNTVKTAGLGDRIQAKHTQKKPS